MQQDGQLADVYHDCVSADINVYPTHFDTYHRSASPLSHLPPQPGSSCAPSPPGLPDVLWSVVAEAAVLLRFFFFGDFCVISILFVYLIYFIVD